MSLSEVETVTDIGRNFLDPKEGGPLKHPIMIITNDHDTVGYLADILEREFGFTIITTFPSGMHKVFYVSILI